MKRTFIILTAIIMTSVTLFTSCTDDTTEPTAPPKVSFVAGAGFIAADATVSVNTPFVVKVLLEQNATSGAKLQSLNITRIFNNQTVGDTTFAITSNDASISMEITFISSVTAGIENIEFELVDKDGQKAQKNLKITTEEISGGAIRSWTEKLLGSWNNATGSSFASINGNVYTIDQAFANQSLIDYMYWWGASTSATIGAPDDANAALVFNTGDYKLDNWTIKNATRFKTTTLTSAAFDAIEFASDIIEVATGANQTRIGSLAVNNVIAFVTVTGKRGLIRVKTIDAGSDGTMLIDVKVEE